MAQDRIGVLGLGSWGTALANHLVKNGKNVSAWDKDAKLLEEIATKRCNHKYHPEVSLEEQLQILSSREELLDSKYIVLAVPASVLERALDGAAINLHSTVVSVIKGVDPKYLLTPLQLVKKKFPSLRKLAVLSGPSFSTDVISGRPAGVVAAAEDRGVAKDVAELFRGDALRVYLSADPLGVELGGISKNVIALAVGVADGLVLGDSARAALITRGLAEMMRLADAMGADRQTLFGLSGMGDLVMTATCDTSRNRTVGLRLGRGEKLSRILETLGSTAEAVKSAPLVLRLAQDYQVNMPITEAVVNLLLEKVTGLEMLHEFVSRPVKSEF